MYANKSDCEIQAQKPSPVTFERYQANLRERISDMWHGRVPIQSTTDLTGRLTNDALNRSDRIEIHYHNGQMKIYASDELKVRDGRIILLQFRLDQDLGEMNSPLIKLIRGLRFENPARDEFESCPLAPAGKLSAGDEIAVVFHRSLPRDPDYKLRLTPNGAYLTGRVLRILEGRDDFQVLLMDRQRRLYQFPLKSVAEFRKPAIAEKLPRVAANETFESFGEQWGSDKEAVRTLNPEQALHSLRNYRGRTNAAILVALPPWGPVVIAINPVDRTDIKIGRDSMFIPWLGLDIPFTTLLAYVDDDTNN